jgi:hypothetical protein
MRSGRVLTEDMLKTRSRGPSRCSRNSCSSSRGGCCRQLIYWEVSSSEAGRKLRSNPGGGYTASECFDADWNHSRDNCWSVCTPARRRPAAVPRRRGANTWLWLPSDSLCSSDFGLEPNTTNKPSTCPSVGLSVSVCLSLSVCLCLPVTVSVSSFCIRVLCFVSVSQMRTPWEGLGDVATGLGQARETYKPTVILCVTVRVVCVVPIPSDANPM